MTSISNPTIHTDYQLHPPPCVPNSTRFVCISDTHSEKYNVPDGDVLIHAGDLTYYGEGLVQTLKWLRSLPHPVKIVVAGNHDSILDANHWSATLSGRNERERILGKGRELNGPSGTFIYLQHETTTFSTEGGKLWKVYGSPSAPRYSDGAFQYSTKTEAEDIYSAIPDDIDILITHTPAYQALDKTRRGKHAGCPVLARRIEELDRCRLHVFGHIHESHGAEVRSRGEGRPDLVAVNAAMSSSSPRVPVVVDMLH